MRNSNYLFTKGSIVFAKFSNKSDKAYLNGRPLIVVSNPTHIMRTLIVCGTGTRNKPGIEVSFYNYADNTYVGGAEVSKIYPYSLLTIESDDIESTIGQLDPYILAEVENAIAFHLGLSNKVPGYLMNTENDITGVSYALLKREHITNDRLSPSFSSPVSFKRETGDFKEERSKSCKLNKKNSNYDKYDRGKKNNKSKNNEKCENIRTVSHVSRSLVKRWSDMISPNCDKIKLSFNNATELLNIIDADSAALIISRKVPLVMVSNKYKLDKRLATLMRITLMNAAIELGCSILNINTTFNGKLVKPNDFTIIGMVLAMSFTPDRVNIAPNKTYLQWMSEISIKYDIDTDNKRTWKNIEEFYKKNN